MNDPLGKAREALDRASEAQRHGFMTEGAAEAIGELIRAVSLLLDGTDPGPFSP